MDTLYLWLWIFFLYAFLGWCSEVVFAAVKTGTFVNRGFLLGPVCPIYGMGVMLVLWILSPLEGNLLILYFGSVVITSALEFLLGWVSEKLLHQRLWDYSNMPFNICGHICLAFSLVWGFACLLVVRVFHPVLMGLVSLISHTIGWILLGVFSALFLTDLVLTMIAALKLPRQVKAVEDMEKLLKGISDNWREPLLRRHQAGSRGKEGGISLPGGKNAPPKPRPCAGSWRKKSRPTGRWWAKTVPIAAGSRPSPISSRSGTTAAWRRSKPMLPGIA